MMLVITGVVEAQVNYTVQTKLKKDYFKVELSITSGTAPFDVIFNGRHVGMYGMFGAYDTINILTVRDANNNERTDTIYEADPHFSWGIGYMNWSSTDPIFGVSYERTGVSIRCSFRDRYNFDIKWYRVSDYTQIGHVVNYEPVPDSIWTYIRYQVDQAPIGTYAVSIRDTVHDMDTLVFVEITNPIDTTTVDTTTIDTTTTDTTQHLSVNFSQDGDNVTFYPNPTNTFCNISEILREVSIFSSKGDLVRVYKNTNRIDISRLPAGNYLVRYTRQDGTKHTKKIIKE